MPWVLLLAVLAAHPRARKHGLDAKTIKTVVSGHLAEANACNRERPQPERPARVSVSWTITQTGHVTDIAVKHGRRSAGEPELEACLVEALSRWTFPSPKHDQKAHYTFRFGPPKAKKSSKRRRH